MLRLFVTFLYILYNKVGKNTTLLSENGIKLLNLSHKCTFFYVFFIYAT